ncbi:hypothetical protein AALF15_01325 [Corynebacteriaceae bacterium 7-707]
MEKTDGLEAAQSTSTTTPATPAASTQAPAEGANVTTEPQRTDAELVEHWKSTSRTWEGRAKQNHADKEAAEVAAATHEKRNAELEQQIADLQQTASLATRYQVALDHGIDRATADKILTATDEDGLTAQAKAFAEAVTSRVQATTPSAESAPHPHGDPQQGAPGAAKPDYKAIAEELRKNS